MFIESFNRHSQQIPSGFITRLMEALLKYNIFSFNDEIFQQLIGVAIGVQPAPSFANIYLAKRIDEIIENLGFKYGKNGSSALLMLKRFLDDLFQIFVGTSKELHDFFEEINQNHPTLKFTMTHTSNTYEDIEDKCTCKVVTAVPYLDTICHIENNRIEIDLFKKTTDRNQYLMPSSCHAKTVTKNIPYSLPLRIVRVCTKPERRDFRLGELRELLLERNYFPKSVDCSITRVRAVPRKTALKRVI